MTNYAWKRFWCPRDGAFSLSDDGYLFDPESEYGDRINPRLVSLPTLADRECLVLLGEPGIGKSTEFSSDFARVQEVTHETTDKALFFNLNEYQTDSRLVTDIFDSDLIREWSSGQHTLHLYFDSLDEGRLEVRNIANILSGQLRKLVGNADRLRLRIACRTAEWPVSLEDTLVSLWGRDEVAAVELTPLRRVDVESAVIAEGMEPQTFLDSVSKRNVEAFAINPITLRFLIGIHKRDGSLPTSRWELYEQGCKRLCEEASQSRRDAGHLGTLSAVQRLEISSRVAALSMFCGRGVIDTGATAAANVDVLSVEDLEGGVERVAGSELVVSVPVVREVLSTTLFSGRGPGKLGFAHRTYAEFLTARYLLRRNLDPTQVNSLLFHPACPTQIVPQLAETAAWVASSNDDVFEQIMSNDPQVLLRSDVATADDATKARLVNRLIYGFRTGQLDDSDWSQRTHYGKLRNTALPTQLGTVICNKNEDVVTRRFAIDVAEACEDTRLIGELLAVALDPEENPHIRGQASHAVIEIADDPECQKLTPLAFGKAGKDPDDELRGSALKGLWRRSLISAEDLFQHLPRQQNSSLIGTYRMFLSEDIHKYLQDRDLAVALRWCSQNPPYRDGVDDLEKPISMIVGRALSFLGDEEVRDAFAEYAVSRMAEYHSILDDMRPLANVDVHVRRELVVAIVRRLKDDTHSVHGLLYGNPALLQDDDLRWLLSTATDPGNADLVQRLGTLAKQLFLRRDRSDVDHVKQCCIAHAILDEVFADLFHPVQIDSPAAEELRLQHANNLELEERIKRLESRRPPALEPPPAARVQRCLARLEAGDLNWWWCLNRELQLGPTDRHYRQDLQSDLTKLPGWSEANDEIRERIQTAARQYLLAWNTNPNVWLGTNTFHLQDFSGYRALVLTARFTAEFFQEFSVERWENWAPVILSFPCEPLRADGDSESPQEFQSRLVAVAYEFASDAMHQALDRLIDRDAARSESGHLFILDQVALCRSEELVNYLLRKARDRSMPVRCIGQLLDRAIQLDPERVKRFALSTLWRCQMSRRNRFHPIRLSLTRTEKRSLHRRRNKRAFLRSVIRRRTAHRNSRLAKSRELAKELATVFWQNSNAADWNHLWGHLIGDRRLLKEVLVEVAHDRRAALQHAPKLNEDQTANLYLQIEQNFPRAEDPKENGAHFVSPRESVQHYRDQLLNSLAERRTPAAIAAIERIRANLPHLDFLDWVVRSARRKTLEATWTPLSIQQAHEITHQPLTRLVRNDRELQQVILESLQRLQRKLHGETPAVRDIWDKTGKKTWKPVDENAFSDYVKRHLDNDLPNCGIVALREVEIRRGNDAKGERTDIYVSATIFGATPGTFDTAKVIVEAKGCWHGELETAMETQLKNRYLRDNDCVYGIYLVGWFACDAWSKTDARKKATPTWTIAAAIDFFTSQSKDLSDDTALLDAAVIDTSLR